MCNLGRYVEYKNNAYVVVKESAKKIHINAPDHRQLQVNKTSVKALNMEPTRKVKINGAKYLVTTKGVIFSCTTGRIMAWNAMHGVGKALLKTVGL